MKTLVALVALGLASQSLAARERPQAVAPDVSGTYTLVQVNGQQVPAAAVARRPLMLPIVCGSQETRSVEPRVGPGESPAWRPGNVSRNHVFYRGGDLDRNLINCARNNHFRPHTRQG